LNILLECFPVLADLVTMVSVDCLCSDCSGHRHQHQSDVMTNRLRLGCLKRMAMQETFLLLAHGLADGFGVSDASSVSDVSPIVEGMAVLLLELVREREPEVRWDTWFAVASCIYLGCPFQKPVPHTHPSFGGTAFAAIQYGNLATQAPWLDLTQENAVRGCFGLIGSKGYICITYKFR